MTVKMSKSEPVSETQIKEFQKETGLRLPASYCKFLQRYNGSTPETNIFGIAEDNESGVNRFIPMAELLVEREFLHSVASNVLPIAWAEGGNYVVIDLQDSGAIYFWDHEEPERRHRLASDIDEFLLNLEAFDQSKVELKDGQVISVWVDPSLLKSNDS